MTMEEQQHELCENNNNPIVENANNAALST